MEIIKNKIPTSKDKDLATKAYESLATYAPKNANQSELSLRILGDVSKKVTIPRSAFELLLKILKEMSQGSSITLMPEHQLLTTQEAADILHVSRPFVTKLLKSKEIPYVRVGAHKRIKASELMNYKEKSYKASEKAMQELANLAQDMDMGY